MTKDIYQRRTSLSRKYYQQSVISLFVLPLFLFFYSIHIITHQTNHRIVFQQENKKHGSRNDRIKRQTTILQNPPKKLAHVNGLIKKQSIEKRPLALLSTTPTPESMIDPKTNATWPRVAWLMSFPNSGTSFTMQLVGKGSGKTTGSNYGVECDYNNNRTNDQLYDDSPSGPYKLKLNKPLPSTYVMTKTHCGGRCSDCSPEHYVIDLETFTKQCTQSSRMMVNGTSGKSEKMIGHYDPLLVSRAVHLVRNPFDNIVSNFHHDRTLKKQTGDHEWLRRYPDTSIGFRAWCKLYDSQFISEERKNFPNHILDLFKSVPCHASFFRIAQWHNLAIRTTKKLSLPTIYVWYEDYETHNKFATNRLFDFLDLPMIGEIPKFIGGKNYNYFSIEEQLAGAKIMKTISSKESYNLLESYFLPKGEEETMIR